MGSSNQMVTAVVNTVAVVVAVPPSSIATVDGNVNEQLGLPLLTMIKTFGRSGAAHKLGMKLADTS